MAEKEAAFCPNCSKPAYRQGKVIVCEHCDASFRFTQEGPRLEQIGPIESRLKVCEEKLGIGATVEAPPAPPAEPDEAEDNDDDDGI
jgi:hypothetical protein